jgi:hypothetical protein
MPLRERIKEMQLYRHEMIPRLCEESRRWVVVLSEASEYQVRNDDERRAVYITVSQRPGLLHTHFQAHFRIRFSLEREPPGLFARVLMRNFALGLSAWSMYIGGSCEACLTIWAKCATSALTTAMFNTICDEMVEEFNGLENELHEKFRYGGITAEYPVEPRHEAARCDSLPQPPMRYRVPGS